MNYRRRSLAQIHLRARWPEASASTSPCSIGFRIRRSQKFRSCDFSRSNAVSLPPLAKHQNRPKKRGPVVIILLMLLPDFFQELLVQKIVLGLDDNVVGHILQFAPEPTIERNGESLFLTVQDVVRKR